MMIISVDLHNTPASHILFISGVEIRKEWGEELGIDVALEQKCSGSMTLKRVLIAEPFFQAGRDYSNGTLSLPVLTPPAQYGSTRGTLIEPQQTQFEKFADSVQPPDLHVKKKQAQRGCGFV